MPPLEELKIVQYCLLETPEGEDGWMYQIVVLERRIKPDGKNHWWAITNSIHNSFLSSEAFPDGRFHMVHESADEKPGIYNSTRFETAEVAYLFWVENRSKIIATSKERYEWVQLQRQK